MATFLCIGDSLTVGADGLGGYSVDGGYRNTLQKRFDANGFAYTFIGPSTANSSGLSQPNHAGFSGYRLDEVSTQVLAMSSTPAPNYILLDIGTNDILQSYLLSGLNTRLDNFITSLKSKWASSIIYVANLFPIGGIYALNGTQQTYYDSYQSHIAALSSAVPVTEMNTAVNASFQTDAVHPTAAGYQIMGDVWYTALIAQGVITVADTKVSALGSLSAQPASNDLLPIVDVSDTTQAASGTTKKIVSAYFAQTNGSVATITGGGTISLGGFTLTVPATGTAALRGVANTFTGANTFTTNLNTFTGGIVSNPVSTSVSGINITSPSGASAAAVTINSADLGSGYNYILIGRNSNGSTPASGWIRITGKTNNDNDLWVDSSATPGILRIGNGTTSSTDTGGSVVGAQTSSLDQKDVIEEVTDYDAALSVIENTPLFRFRYKDGRLGGGEYLGIITDYSPVFGADPDEEHANGRILNEINAHGYAMAAIKALAERVKALENA